jgi:WD40 repeat protein
LVPAADAFSPDNRLLAIGYPDGSVQLWDVPAGQELCRWPAHARSVRNLVFTPEGDLATTEGQSSAIRVWHLTKLRHRLAEIGLGW